MFRNSTRLFESDSVTKGYQADQIEENSEVEMEMTREEMNITITDKDRLSFFKILRMAMRRRIESFAQDVSIVGLSHLVKPSAYKVGSVIRKVVWTMLLLFGIGFMTFQIYDRASYYLTYQTVVDYRVAYNRSLGFPTVTILSESVISMKAIRSLESETIKTPAIVHRLPPISDIQMSESYGQTDMSLYQLDLNWDFLYAYIGTKVKDMILECSFGNRPCNLDDTATLFSSNVDYVLSFNPGTTNYVTTQPGANYGLRLVLWVNQSDAFLIESPGVGFKVILHDPRESCPDPMELGFRVGTGVSTSVSFSLRNLSMLPSPYGDCNDDESYTFMACMERCLVKHTMSVCGCRLVTSNVPGPACSLEKLAHCIPNSSQIFVRTGMDSKCGCPLQCHQLTYPLSVTTSPLSEHFLNYMSQRSQFKGRNLNMSRLSKELVFLDIFYSDLNYANIQTNPAYDLLTLVCDVGGALGLILGGTLLTLVELAQLLLHLFSDVLTSAKYAKMQRR